ncbi:MAG: non-canonical purine NTP pyrophosphatase, RdgB/HAM1 family [Ignavibacteriae bacterium HGW-Ignavibacteriae-4]|jgi:XTP/dITP diphosphohydrolase|nr:MAG: non-canonical purine NTP pyrophosphatase, RdgB/HAM1 family [Ignavibacteriae bacterium HGW-Ignavibacteriae-4]
MRIAAATNNLNKITEIQHIMIASGLENTAIVSPKSLNIISDPDENSDTLEGNARIKAISLFEKTGIPSFADDTGLFVEELSGKPGVRSARFASENANDSDNRKLLLKLLEGKTNRKAYFETVICFISDNEEKYFSGRCTGFINSTERGSNGFGYDSIFIPDGYNETFAELAPNIKNKISHRYNAIIGFTEWLKSL